jgi:hypothetical protein
MKLHIPTFKSDIFSWKNGVGSAEVSDFRGSDLFSRVYDDACNVGFNVQSVRTGKVELFTLETAQRDPDDDVTEWEFSSKEGHKIIIFND